MSVKIISVFLIIVLMCSSSVFAETNEVSDVESDSHLKEYEELCDFYIQKLTEAKKDILPIYKALAEQKMLSDKKSALLRQKVFNEQKYDQLDAKLNSANEIYKTYKDFFEGLSIASADIYTLKSAKQLMSEVNTAIKKISEYKTCYIKSIEGKSKACSFVENETCQTYGFDASGLYHESTSDFYTIDKKYIELIDIEPSPEQFNDLKCYFKGERSGQYSQELLLVEASLIYSTQGYGLHDTNNYKNLCIENDWIAKHNTNLDRLREDYPLFYKELYLYDTQAIQSNCTKWAGLYCSNTYVVRNEIIMSYPTTGCQIRDVTKADVENDIKYIMDTNAEKLNHSTLLDKIEFCQAVSDKGYKWGYDKPSLGDSCKDNKPRKKIKRK